ncbi:diaminopimelate epimerase [Lentibacter sp. XHP0401]|jgi:diaminopimelate epimerase|uniref:diaminopimelate epimerase n=1 Tax=Lentibacter sp. XHP0401 TaxID=2984334 RepID=UPI0021E7AACA|nr:diaminopimelate epimerase [Lentibacter sp. XHP0401]
MRLMNTRATHIPFMKMHGLGNDFVIIDSRGQNRIMTAELARAMGDRHRGVGYDQLAEITDAPEADFHLTFWNSDGSQAGACGNATRCIAHHVMRDTGKTALHITTARGDLYALDAGGGLTSVNMGQPMTSWQDIPLAQEADTLALPIEGAPVATSMGNPHCSFFVPDAEAVSLEAFGAAHEHHPLFPERTNVQVASVIGPDHLRMRVWERGVGITQASGSSSCAVAVAAARLGLTGHRVRIELDGGTLMIDWRDDGVWMTGETAHVFDGVWRL